MRDRQLICSIFAVLNQEICLRPVFKLLLDQLLRRHTRGIRSGDLYKIFIGRSTGKGRPQLCTQGSQTHVTIGCEIEQYALPRDWREKDPWLGAWQGRQKRSRTRHTQNWGIE